MLQEVSSNRWSYAGVLSRENVAAEWASLKKRDVLQHRVEVELSRLKHVDSAGLAMLVCWQGLVKKRGGELRFVDIPSQLATLIRVSDLDELFFTEQES